MSHKLRVARKDTGCPVKFEVEVKKKMIFGIYVFYEIFGTYLHLKKCCLS